MWQEYQDLASNLHFRISWLYLIHGEFPACLFKEVWVACMSPEWSSGTGRDFDLAMLQV